MWYPTWAEDNELQVDYIRIYAATMVNNRSQTYNVGDGNRYLWQQNCTVKGELGEEPNPNGDVNQCATTCLKNSECNIFSIINGKCVWGKELFLSELIHLTDGGICGYIPSRSNENIVVDTGSDRKWIYVVIPCILIFLIVAAFLFYTYKVTNFYSSLIFGSVKNH